MKKIKKDLKITSSTKGKRKSGDKEKVKIKKAGKKQQVSHLKKPEKMSITEWQTILRKQIADTIPFRIENITKGLAYADYRVFNPVTNNSYKIAFNAIKLSGFVVH